MKKEQMKNSRKQFKRELKFNEGFPLIFKSK